MCKMEVIKEQFEMTTKHLDLGCGSNPRNPFACDELYGIDIIKQEKRFYL